MRTNIRYCKTHQKDKYLTVEGCPGCLAMAVDDNDNLRARIRELEGELAVYRSSVEKNADALGFLQGTAPAAFLGRHLAEYAAHRIRQLEATPDGGWFLAWETADKDRQELRARVAELEAYVDLLVHGERHPHDLVFALWNETAGGAAADKASADLRTRIRELEAENARLLEALKRVRCCEDAVCDQCLREVDAALKVKP